MRRMFGLAVALVLLVSQAPAHAQGFNQIGFNVFTTAVTITTTAENVVVSSGPVTAPRQTINVCVIGFAQFTTGTMTTGVIPRLRRGTTTAGTLLGEENTITVGAAAGSTEQFLLFACEERADVATVEYSLSMDQVAADGNGSAIFGGILVLVR